VLDEGCIVERGTHASLLAAGGYYARVAEEQGREDAEPRRADGSGGRA